MTDVTRSPDPQTPDVIVDPVPRRGAGLGITSLVLAILAIAGDIVVVVFVISSIAQHAGSLDLQTGLSLFIGFFVLALIAYWGGVVVGVIALLLGIIAAIKRRGRGAGLVGAVLASLVLLTRLVVGVIVAGSGDVVSSILPF